MFELIGGLVLIALIGLVAFYIIYRRVKYENDMITYKQWDYTFSWGLTLIVILIAFLIIIIERV